MTKRLQLQPFSRFHKREAFFIRAKHNLNFIIAKRFLNYLVFSLPKRENKISSIRKTSSRY